MIFELPVLAWRSDFLLIDVQCVNVFLNTVMWFLLFRFRPVHDNRQPSHSETHFKIQL